MIFYKKLKKLFSQQCIYNEISSILEWDMATMMPKNSRASRIKQIEKLTENKKKIFEEIKKQELFSKVNVSKLNNDEKRNFFLMKKKYDYFICLPQEVIVENQKLAFECEGKWREAREKNDFRIVKKIFSKLFSSVIEKAKILSEYWEIDKYDAMLFLYDKSFNCNQINKFTSDLEFFFKENYDNFLLNQNKKKIYEFDSELSEDDQHRLSKIVMKRFGFNFNNGRVDLSLHPFCGGYKDDIRITTKFNKYDFFSSFDALMHETGHALYEFGLPKKWKHQLIGESSGMAMHESQSLFLEMQIVKSKEFNFFLNNLLIKLFKKKTECWGAQNLFFSRSKISKGFIRIESDEVHYPLHIIHRFKIEKKIFEEQSVDDLPDLWNSEFKRIFNLNIKSDNEGCLQDIHWFTGDFGYFPTYLIGAMIAAQLKSSILEEIPDLKSKIKLGKLDTITKWLRKSIHQYGDRYCVDDLLKKITGKKLSTSFYKSHLKKRYLS